LTFYRGSPKQKVSFIRINWKGDIVCVAGGSGYSANPFRVRWQLETLENPEQRNEFCRSIITRKIEATIITLEKSIPRSDKWERAVRSAYAGLSRLEETPPETIIELRFSRGQLRRFLFSQLGRHADQMTRPKPQNNSRCLAFHRSALVALTFCGQSQRLTR
jgi:hypothetical protein